MRTTTRESSIERRGPRNRIVAWSDIKDIKWRSAMKWLDIVPVEHRSRLHFSPLLADSMAWQ
jgi:hypothetical protein